MVYIYALLCPITAEVRYIGKAEKPAARLRSHLARARTTNESHHCCNWVRSLLRRGLRPIQVIIDEVENDCWQEAERWHIAEAFAAGCRLTNIRPGGEGVALSPDGRTRLSEKSRARWRDPEYAARTRASLSRSIAEKHSTEPDYYERCKRGSQKAWARRKAVERYQIHDVRDAVAAIPRNVVYFEEIYRLFSSTRRTIISRHFRQLCEEGALHLVSHAAYAKDIGRPCDVAAEIAARAGLRVTADDFELVGGKTKIRVRGKEPRVEFTREIRIGGKWLSLKSEARQRLTAAAIARIKADPAYRAKRSAIAYASWADDEIRARRTEAIRLSLRRAA